MDKKQLGKLGEDLACNYLKKQGYKILERNFLIRGGELDIVAQDKDVLVAVEVKTRFSNQYGTPEEAITFWKLKAVVKTLQIYKASHQKLPEALRIDLVAIEMDGNGVTKRIELIKNITE